MTEELDFESLESEFADTIRKVRKLRRVCATVTMINALVGTATFGVIAGIVCNVLFIIFFGLKASISTQFTAFILGIIGIHFIVGVAIFYLKDRRRLSEGRPVEGKLSFVTLDAWMILIGPVLVCHYIWELKLYFWLNEENQRRIVGILVQLMECPDNIIPMQHVAIDGVAGEQRVHFLKTLEQFGWVQVDEEKGIVSLSASDESFVEPRRRAKDFI